MNTSIIDPNLSQQITLILSQKFDAAVAINNIDILSDDDRRNKIWRIHLQPTLEIPASIIFKQSLRKKDDIDDEGAIERFARDWAGLKFMDSLNLSKAFTPSFYGGNKEQRFILTEDLGYDHISLVDTLTLPGQDKAVKSLYRFIETLAHMHQATIGNTSAYLTMVNNINPHPYSWQNRRNELTTELLKNLTEAINIVGISIEKNTIDEIKNVIQSLYEPSSFTGLIHGDICPDNVFITENNFYIIDFEWAHIGHVLLDGVYLRMNMPSCWCARALPNDLIEFLESKYRNILASVIPEVANDEVYHTAYTHACAFWLLSTLRFIPDVIANDKSRGAGPVPLGSLWKHEDNLIRPRILSRLYTFIEVSRHFNTLPNLYQTANNIFKKLNQLWPNTKPLALYPVFELV